MANVIGRIAQDARVKTTESGKELIEFTVVENFRYKDKAGAKKDDPTFYNCVKWNSTTLAPYLKKGVAVSIEGQIGAEAYKSKKEKGALKASLKFTVRRLEFLPSTKKEAQPATADEGADDLPF